MPNEGGPTEPEAPVDPKEPSEPEGTFNHSTGANEKDVNVYFKLTNENTKTIYYIKAASKQTIAY